MNNTHKIPVAKNEIVEIEITGITSEGSGVGRIKGFTIFVPETVEGDFVRIKILKLKKSYGYGKVIKIIKSSKKRTEPVCKIFGRCGGCQLQHIKYDEQLTIKTGFVKDALERIGGFKGVMVENCIGMKDPLRYRNKVQYPVSYNENKKQIEIGFYAERSHRIIEADTCYLQPEICDDILIIFKKWINRYNISIYNEKTSQGYIRHIYIRKAFVTDEVMIIIVTNGRNLPYKDELIKMLCNLDNKIVSIMQNINIKNGNRITGKEIKCLWGKDYITEQIGDLKYKISPLSFYQVNSLQTKMLYEKVLEFAGLKGDETVFDLYCGIGSITLFFAKHVNKVVGVEIVPDAIKDAERNADINGIDNVSFYQGAVEKIVPELYKEGIAADVVVVDPPRKGCDEKLLATIIKMQVRKIVYVSCNPATLARDLKYLAVNGYSIEKAQPVDMFPQTYHVETVVLLEKK